MAQRYNLLQELTGPECTHPYRVVRLLKESAITISMTSTLV